MPADGGGGGGRGRELIFSNDSKEAFSFFFCYLIQVSHTHSRI
jgi:hypothetical protein